jgi:hypothetical protein
VADDQGEAVLVTFSWTIQFSSIRRAGRIVDTGSGTELRYEGIDGQERRVPVDLDYQPPSLDSVPPELVHLQAVSTEVGFAARALLGFMISGDKPHGTVVPFDIADHVGEPVRRYAGRLEHHANAAHGVSVYTFEV